MTDVDVDGVPEGYVDPEEEAFQALYNTGDGELRISSGTAIAVDSDILRAAADSIDRLARRLDVAEERMNVARNEDWEVFMATGDGDETALMAANGRALAESLRGTAEVYDFVERAAQALVMEADGKALAMALLMAGVRADPAFTSEVWEDAESVALQWWIDRYAGIREQYMDSIGTAGLIVGGLLGVFLAGSSFDALTDAIDDVGLGTRPADPARSAFAAPVTVTRVSQAAAAAPQGFADMAERIPDGGETRIRVERYDFGDGSHEFVLYVSGTQNQGFCSPDAFDNGSNLELYFGYASESYDAVLQALADAGVEPGDVLHVNGYSQAGMIVSYLATGGDYRVETMVTYGSPVQVPVPGDTDALAVSHTNDPVAALAAGGVPGGVGATSVVAQRAANVGASVMPVSFSAHKMSEYERTAAEVDASPDPRLDPFRDTLNHLADADTVEEFVYTVTVESSDDADD